MKIINLTKGRSTVVCDCHYDLVKNEHWQYHDNGYAITGKYQEGKHRILRLHRLVNQTPSGYDTDHINGDKLDNRCANLRTATRSQNNRNSKIRVNNTSGHRGVTWDRVNKKWVAQITFGGRTKKIGRYSTVTDAVIAYNGVSEIVYKDFHG